jgi:hypothetical protein
MESLEVARETLVVLYEGETGRIVHTHRIVTFQGGDHPDEATLETQALEQFRQADPKFVQKPRFLHAAPGSMKAETLYRVDLTKNVLVEMPQSSGS